MNKHQHTFFVTSNTMQKRP
uniref:Uncharacterized protein n=1 Tax=Anguilla anguilla TaxID=7936 RepID=A0A0E9SZ84_ANGAN